MNEQPPVMLAQAGMMHLGPARTPATTPPPAPVPVEPAATVPPPSPALDFGDQVDAGLEAAPHWGQELAAAFGAAFDTGPGDFAVTLLAMVLIGFAGERLVCWKLNALNRTIASQHSERWAVNLGYALFRVFFDLVSVVLFGAIAGAVLYFMGDQSTQVYATLRELLLAIVKVRASLVVVRAVLAPGSEGIRPLRLSTADAVALYRWVAAFVAAYAGVQLVAVAVFSQMSTEVLEDSSTVLLGLSLPLVIVAFGLVNKDRLDRLFADPVPDGRAASALRQVFAQSWPYGLAVWMLLLWGSWAYAILTADARRLDATLVSWWITLLFPVGDRLVRVLLNQLTTVALLRESSFQERRDRFIATVQLCIRLILAAVAVIALAMTWNLLGKNLIATGWGQRVVWAAVDIGTTLLIAYVLYELVMALLDKHMPRPSEEGEGKEIEGEGGGPGATRQQTLAPLLRGVFLVTLVIVVTLSVLSSMGVQILPLIAGASIVGLAIGFGSQKLVADIISGVFFLIDDAFRRGEYIDIGDIKGTVEKISIRSMQLRHHMGALHTIPFGDIARVTNYSRDWVMMKLKLRLTYDTDVDKVRKLIKKLGQELLEDEEIGELFLQPLKSQGVYSMEDDSAMIIRVKFMTRPGDQFIVRKKVYARIRELFEENGIEFAHRVVSVRIDGAEHHELSEQEKQAVAGAALPPQPQAGGG